MSLNTDPQPLQINALPSYTEEEMPLRSRFTDGPWLHLILLLLTFFTTAVIGARFDHLYTHNLPLYPVTPETHLRLFPLVWLWHNPSLLLRGVSFSLALMAILLAHEMGHYLACRHYGVSATLPYFIPAPTLVGTMGAFIQIRSRFPSRRALFDIGIAGPIAGFIVALPVTAVGLLLSHPVAAMPESELALGFPPGMVWIYYLLQLAGLQGPLPMGNLILHPLAIAGWTGLFATALNLLPAGQLDGGHIVYAISARAHWLCSRLTVVALIPLGIFGYMGWMIWALVLAVLGLRHPWIAEDRTIGRRDWWLAGFAALMLVFSLAPAVFQQSSWLDAWPDMATGAQQLFDSARHLVGR